MESGKANIKYTKDTNECFIYPGCLNLYRFPEYEYSAVKVLKILGINAKSLPDSVCCGSFMEGQSENWEYLAAYNLSLAEKHGRGVITLCGGCTSSFLRIKKKCLDNGEFKHKLNKKLDKMD